MQVAQAEVVCLIDDDGIGIGYVDAVLYDRGGYEHVVVVVDEAHDDLLQLLGRHLSVPDTHTGIGHIACDECRQLGKVLYAVVDDEELSVAAELKVHRLADNLLVEGVHLGLYGIAVGRWSLYDAQVACSHERELQGARYRGGRERERIYTHLQLAQLLLHRYAKLLLLIDDEQTQVFELHALSYEFVCAHHDVHLTVLEPLQHLLRVGSRAGTAQVLHAAGEVFQSLREGAPMLVGQHGGGHQHRHLLVVTCRLEGSTHGHLGLAEAHVATHEAVHRALPLHVGLDVDGSLQLVGRVFVEEARLQLVLHEAVGAIGKALLLRTLRVELDEVAGDILDLGLGALLELLPRARAQLIDARRLALLALVLGYLVQ